MDNDKTKYGDGEVGCVTDDPFGGVNKERDSMMMSQVILFEGDSLTLFTGS